MVFGKNTKTKDVGIGCMRLPRKLKLARNDKDKDVGGSGRINERGQW